MDQAVDDLSDHVSIMNMISDVGTVVTATNITGLAFAALSVAVDTTGFISSSAQSQNFSQGMSILTNSASAYFSMSVSGATTSVMSAGIGTTFGVFTVGTGLGLAIGTGVNYFPAGNGQNVMEWWAESIGDYAYGDIERFNAWKAENDLANIKWNKFMKEIRSMNAELERYNNLMGGNYNANDCK